MIAGQWSERLMNIARGEMQGTADVLAINDGNV